MPQCDAIAAIGNVRVPDARLRAWAMMRAAASLAAAVPIE
jgi:hypothetical protein